MLECWDAQPCRRPSFSELVMKLGKLLENNVKEVSELLLLLISAAVATAAAAAT